MSNIFMIFAIFIAAFIGLIFFNLGGLLLNDVSTTPLNPPQYDKIKVNAVPFDAALNQHYYPDMHPLVMDFPTRDAFARVLEIIKDKTEWEIVSVDSERYKIEAVDTTPLMRFKDDIVIEIRPENEKSSLHMRSKSRIGKGDLGKNAKRIRKFLNTVQKSEK